MNYGKFIELVVRDESVNATAKALGIPQSTFDHYVKGSSVPTPNAVILMAARAGVPVADAVIACAELEQKLHPKKAYGRMAAGLAASVFVTLFLTSAPSPAEAKTALSDYRNALYYVKSRKRKLQALQAWLASFFRLAPAPATP